MIDIDPVGIVGSGVILSPPRFFLAGVDFCTAPSYFKIRKAVFHLYHDSPPLIPYRRRSSFFLAFLFHLVNCESYPTKIVVMRELRRSNSM